jgi:hypothetical protein
MVHMDTRITALRAILQDAGLRPFIANRIQRLIDSDDYIGLQSDDIAERLFYWRDRAVSLAKRDWDVGQAVPEPVAPHQLDFSQCRVDH